MALSSASMLLAMTVALCCLGATFAQPQPGPVFPFYDNARRGQDHQLRNVTALPPKTNTDGSVDFCFRVNVVAAKCEPEIFFQKKRRIVSRCCNTTFAKIKFYANSACKDQLKPSQLTVPLATRFSKVVSPVWEYLNTNYTSVKYTQFGPIPQELVDGTTFCLKIAKPAAGDSSTCAQTLKAITHPAIQSQNLFQVAIYDRKVDNYECAPTFTYNSVTRQAVNTTVGTRRMVRLRQTRKHMA